MSVNIPTSMEQQVNDEEDDRKFVVTWKTNETGSIPEYRQTSMRELSEIAKDNKITHLRFRHDYPDKLPADIRDSLVWLDIPFKERHAVLSDLPSLRSLTVHRVDDGHPFMDPSQLSTQLSMLKSLEKLTLKYFSLDHLPQSISKLTELEELVLAGNYLSNVNNLGEILSSLKKLKKLDLSKCGLSAIPSSSISDLTELEELILADNYLGLDDHLGEILSSLKKLKKLDLSECELSAVPSSSTLDQLEHLLIQRNKNLYEDTSLNSKLSQLKSLKTLHIGKCGLKEIPSGIKELTQLTDLNMAGNEFSDDFIPTWFTELRSLKILDISGFKTLKKLPQTIVSLTKLDCDGCTALVEPPRFVCSGGLNNIKQYFKDMEAGHHSMTLSTIVVIGRKMAGKSSLVKSLIEGKIERTLRDNFAPGDETTKVFDFGQLKLTNASNHHKHAVNVIDFGGDEIYHSAYLLTFKKDCIPAVVVNMEEYEKMSRQWGPREAARRLVFEWIAHLYLACPDIGDPILALTHMDTLQTPESACSYRDELVKTLEELLSDLKNQNAVSEKIGFFKRGFAACKICEIRHDKPYNEVYKELESIICNRVGSSSVSLPNSWKEIITSIKGRETATLHYVTLKHELSLDGTSERQLDVVLDFMQRSGEIIRYQNTHTVHRIMEPKQFGNRSSLEDTIFHRVSEITKVIKLLFDHSISEYKGSVKAETLEHVLTPATNTDKNIKADTAIILLKAFNLIHGPITYNSNPSCYLIPQFMSYHEFPPPTGDIQLRTDMNFVGLSIPSFAYQQSTVTILSSLPKSPTQFFPYGNGISCRITKSPSDPLIDIHLIHEIVEQRIRLRVEGCAEVITDMWDHLLNLIKDITSSIRDVWPAAKLTYELPCSHCLITNKLNPEKRTNPDFIIQASEGKLDRIDYRRENTTCGTETVPAALRFPIRQLSNQAVKKLKEELQTKPYIQRPDAATLIQKTLDQKGINLDLEPTLQTSLYTPPISVPKVYQMTPTRGRALIINNKDLKMVNGVEKSRLGSQYDFNNVKIMFEKFGFVISELSMDKNWTGKAIVDAIHQETQYVDGVTGSSVHDCLGMFVLVLMSHGGLGTIDGCDDNTLRLKDIYGLLSSYNFPAMKGKPKLIILQACSGGERERPDFTTPADPRSGLTLSLASGEDYQSINHDTMRRNESSDLNHPPVNPLAAEHQTLHPHTSLSSDVVPDPAPPVESRPVPDIPLPSEVDLENSHLSVDDLLIMKPSFDDFISFRDEDKGSYFIRALVTAFYLCAAENDLRTLADMTIQEVVRAESKRLTQQMLRHEGEVKERHARQVSLKLLRDHGQRKEVHVGQVPVTTCTFTKDRKLYLSPGVHMRTSHPESITNPRPDCMRTEIKWHTPGYDNTNTPRFDVIPKLPAPGASNTQP